MSLSEDKNCDSLHIFSRLSLWSLFLFSCPRGKNNPSWLSFSFYTRSFSLFTNRPTMHLPSYFHPQRSFSTEECIWALLSPSHSYLIPLQILQRSLLLKRSLVSLSLWDNHRSPACESWSCHFPWLPRHGAFLSLLLFSDSPPPGPVLAPWYLVLVFS